MGKGARAMTVELGLIFTILSLIIGFLGFRLNKTNQQLNLQENIKKEATNDAEVKVTLAHISKGVDDIKIDVRSNKEQMNAFAKDLVRVEESAKQAHKRINEIAKSG